MISTVEIHNEKNMDKISNNIKPIEKTSSDKPDFSLKKILIIIIPTTVVLLFAAIFIPVYIMSKKDDEKEIVNNIYMQNEVYDEYIENVANYTYATLTPKDGYDSIFVFLGGIGNQANDFFPFFKSTSTFIPMRTKIYFLSGKIRQIQFAVDYNYPVTTVPCWFNIDAYAKLCPIEHDFTEARESRDLILDIIDKIKEEENIEYRNIYLGGFSQGALMINYIILNSRHELGGYIAFSGYVFDEDFAENYIIKEEEMTTIQKNKLKNARNYHILATHSMEDTKVGYQLSVESYRVYYHDYTYFKLFVFGNLEHKFPEQPIHSYVKKWLKERMGK